MASVVSLLKSWLVLDTGYLQGSGLSQSPKKAVAEELTRQKIEVLELDVTNQASVDAAVSKLLDKSKGALNVVRVSGGPMGMRTGSSMTTGSWPHDLPQSTTFRSWNQIANITGHSGAVPMITQD